MTDKEINQSEQHIEGHQTDEPTPGEPPYKGLAYFTEADRDIYFGREKLSDKLVRRLRERGWAIQITKPGAERLLLADWTISRTWSKLIRRYGANRWWCRCPVNC